MIVLAGRTDVMTEPGAVVVEIVVSVLAGRVVKNEAVVIIVDAGAVIVDSCVLISVLAGRTEVTVEAG